MLSVYKYSAFLALINFEDDKVGREREVVLYMDAPYVGLGLSPAGLVHVVCLPGIIIGQPDVFGKPQIVSTNIVTFTL